VYTPFELGHIHVVALELELSYAIFNVSGQNIGPLQRS
jgi:hypothetical protein